MDDAGALIQATLDDVKTFLAQESPPRLSEADTKAHFVEPIVKALGWEGIGAVTREYYVRNSQEFIDDALKGPDGRPLVAIETKALQAALTDKHAAQLIQYCAVEGIEWAALTNGRELQFFNAFLTGDLAAKRLLRLDLLAFNSDEEFAAVRAQLSQLSLASMTTATGVGKLFPLVEAGLLPDGTALHLAKGGQAVLRATVDAQGRIVADGKLHRSPSDRACARRLNRQSLNGWTACRAELPEGLTTLADLRQRLGEAAESESA